MAYDRNLSGYSADKYSQKLKRVGGVNPESRVGGVNPESRVGGVNPESRVGGVNPESNDDDIKTLRLPLDLKVPYFTTNNCYHRIQCT